MFDNILAIIPCRAGSQRFPGKNMALFNGVPLVVHKIRQAKEAGLINVVVTTNSPVIKDLAQSEGVLILNRTEDLCTPEASQEDVIRNAIFEAVYMDIEFDTFCSLQVTSPTLAVESLVDALQKYQQNNTCRSIAAVTEAYQPSGGFHIVDVDLFMQNHSLYQKDGGVYVLPPEQCIDVDYSYQLEIAKCILHGNVCGHANGECSCSK